ncbi:MAG: acyl-CoA dehydrogenase family protein [Saprospiraceae bacterium]
MYADLKIKRAIYDSEEHQMLRETVREFLKQHVLPYREEWEEVGYCSREAWRKAGELGLLNISLSEKYGGAGLDFSFSALIIEELSRAFADSPSISMHSDIVGPYIETYGSEFLKERYLPKMATGEWIGSLGMTEPSTGSDLQAIKTNAVDKGDHWLLNGSKTFITIGYTSDFTIVACKTNPGTSREGLSLLVVDAALEGFSKGKPFKKIGLKTSDTCELFFEDVKVPKANLLGEEGKGFIYMMTELPRERLTIALQSIGACEGAIEDAIQYTSERHAFGQAIAGFQNTQFKMAEMATKLQIHQVFIDKCTELLIKHELTAEQASMAKYSATEVQFEVLDNCLQLHGGYGYIWEYPIARAFSDSRVARIYGGTNEIMKVMIARRLFSGYFAELKAKKRATMAETR